MSLNNRIMADISDYQARFDAHAYRSAGHLMIAIKAGEAHGHGGAGHYAERVRAAHRAGLVVAHYWFCRPESGDPAGQMHAFWAVVANHFESGDYLVLDVETGNPATAGQWLDSAAVELHRISHHNAICYTYSSYLASADRGHPLDVPAHRFWIANYDGTRSLWRLPRFGQRRRRWARQYTDGQTGAQPRAVAGIGHCDLSVVNGATVRHVRRLHKRGA